MGRFYQANYLIDLANLLSLKLFRIIKKLVVLAKP